MAWRTTKVAEQRMEFVVAANRKEKSFKELCKEFQISCRTGYTWPMGWVYYRGTLVCELDPLQSRSFAGDRTWSCKTSSGKKCEGCVENDL
jgi:hypothetical protein